jgi:Spy/CpxP family protein refolding chaperone
MRVMLTLALTVAVALPAAAQRPDTTRMRMGGQHQGMQHNQPGAEGMRGMGGQGMQGGMGETMGMMMGGAAPFAPAKLLDRREQLGLSDEQVTKLTELDQATTAAADQAHQPAHAAMQTLRAELAQPAPDTAKVHAYLNAHDTAMGNVMWLRIKAALEAKTLLTEAQREQVAQP